MSGDERWFLKIGDRLARECAGLRWLQSRLAVPQVVAFGQFGGTDALLMTAVPGTNLARLAKRLPQPDIVAMLASALRAFHSVSADDCLFEAYIPGKSLVHGDACLPNFVFGDDGLNGYIDLGDMGVGDVEVDLSAAVWSLQYNLGPGFGLGFLKAYGRPNATEYDVERLWTRYATRAALPASGRTPGGIWLRRGARRSLSATPASGCAICRLRHRPRLLVSVA